MGISLIDNYENKYPFDGGYNLKSVEIQIIVVQPSILMHRKLVDLLSDKYRW